MLKELRSIINTVLSNRDKKQVDEINESTDLRNDIGMDSLDLAELTVRIEAKYDVDIFKDDIVNTVGEIIKKIDK